MNNVAIKLESDQEQKIVNNAQELVAQASRVVIASNEDNEKASDLVKFIKTCFKKAEDDRKSITDPLNAVIKNINARYKLITEPLLNAEHEVKTAMLTFSQEQRRIAEQKERDRRAAEEAALLEQAAKAEQENKPVDADMLLDQAAEVNSAPVVVQQPQTVRGDYGSSSSIKKTWTYRVTDIKALAAAHPELVLENSPVIRQRIREGIREMAGVEIYQEESIAVR